MDDTHAAGEARGAFRDMHDGVYLVRLDSVRLGGEPLHFRPGANMVRGLTATASLAVWQTIVGIEQGSNEHGLSGKILIDGSVHLLDDQALAAMPAILGPAEGGAVSSFSGSLGEVAQAWLSHQLATALSVTKAELRGARQAVEDRVEASVGNRVLEDISAQESDEIEATINEISAMLLDELSLRAIQALVDRVDDPTRVTQLRDVLEGLSIPVSGSAVEVGQRVLNEQTELLAIRARLQRNLDSGSIGRDEVSSMPRLHRLHAFVARLEGKHRTQEQLLRFVEGDQPLPIRPLVLVEPLEGLPIEAVDSVLRVLDDVAKVLQVVVLSNDDRVIEYGEMQGWHGETPTGWFREK